MKTSNAVCASIFLAFIILLTGLIGYISVQAFNERQNISGSFNPLMSSGLQTSGTADESGNFAEQWGYVEISKEELETISAQQLKEFADSYVKGSDYQWISITTPNGDGIYFPRSDNNYAEYGILSENGKTKTLQAMIVLEKSTYKFYSVGGE